MVASSIICFLNPPKLEHAVPRATPDGGETASATDLDGPHDEHEWETTETSLFAGKGDNHMSARHGGEVQQGRKGWTGPQQERGQALGRNTA